MFGFCQVGIVHISMVRFVAKFIKLCSSNRICRVELIGPDDLIEIFEVFANNTTLTMFTYLTYLPTLCFNLGRDYPDMCGTH